MQLTQTSQARAEPENVSVSEQLGRSVLTTAKYCDLAEVLNEAATCIGRPSASQIRTLERLNVLRERLATERFQLAVLGQFKRGKSTVLNALLGQRVLPIGVVPVTAIPTFLEPATTPAIRVTYISGKLEKITPKDTEALREKLTAFVTEEGNPRNVLNVARVDVFLSANLLKRGVVLIDTPGIGSTHRHQTAAADAVLPECDAALLIVSADPPITEVEMEYLARIRQTVAQLIVVLNKIDIIEPHERKKAADFLRSALVDHAGLDPFTPIFSLSARDALRAKESGDAEALAKSGFADLEGHLVRFLATKKRETLNAAVARKAAALVAQLELETEIAVKSLRLPVEDLERRMATFDDAAQQFQVERRTANDLLAGDRLRALQELEAEAERLRTQARHNLQRELDQALAAGEDSEDARARLSASVIEFFEEALRDVIRKVGARLEEALRGHQRRADELITLVRQTAANLLDIPFHAPESSEAFEARREPFWVTAARTSELNPIPPGAFDRFLPAPMRKRRMQKRLLEEIDAVVVRNVENLRWATRQNMEDTFRSFGAELDEQLAMSLDATRGAMEKALQQRKQHSEQIDFDIETKQTALLQLAEIAQTLARQQTEQVQSHTLPEPPPPPLEI
ncbi:MAG TPA: dynamin family protein [Candidatus Udaeobacter sp.]|nr:dynamin family protein [Candidatus Udaeobacter sp.]